MAANSDIIKIGFDYETGLQEFIKDYDGTMNKVQKSADGKRVEIQFDVSDKDVMKKISALQGDLKNVKIELNGKALNQQLESVDQLRETLTDIIKLINQGVNIKSIIDSSSINADIEKIENRINDLTKKYENFQKKASDSISGENISLINNEDFKKVQSDVENIKKEIDGLRHNLEQFEQDGYNTGSFVQYLNDQVMSAWENIEKLTSKFEDFHSLVEKLKVDFPETNISLGDSSTVSVVDKTTNSLIDEQKALGELQLAFRGIEGSLNGFMTTSERLGTFFTTSPLLARQYADSLGGVYQAMVALGNSLQIDAEGRDWNAVEYLGNGSDEASKKIIELRNQINSLYEQLNASGISGTGLDGRAEQVRGDFSHIIQFYGDAGIEYNSYIEAVEKGNIIENQENETVKNLMTQLYNLEKAYKAISDARNNVYGTHTTDEFAELAKANGYDSVMFRNIKDSFDRTKNLTDVGVIFDESQVANVKNVSDQIDNLVSRIDGVKSQHGLNLPINIELPKEIFKLEDGSFVNNLTGEIYSDVQTAIESLKELETQTEKTAQSIKEVSSVTPEKDLKDAFQNQSQNTPSEALGESAEASAKPIKEEADALDQAKQSATGAAEAKQKFVEANKDVKQSADASVNAVKEEADALEKVSKNSRSETYSELNKSLTQYQQIKTRIAQNRAYATDEEDAEKLLAIINDLRNKGVLSDDQLAKSQTRLDNINKLVENIQKKTTDKILDSNDKDVANWKAKLEARNVKPKEQSDDYNKILINMKEYYSELKALQDKMRSNAQSGIAPSKEDLAQFDSLKTKLKECTQSFNNMTAAEKGSTAISRDKLYNKIGDYLEKNSGMAKEYKNQLKALQAELSDRGPNANVTDLADRFVQLQARIREAGQEGRSFLDVLKDKVWYGFASQIAMYFSLNNIIRYVKEGVTVVRELDTALTEMQKVSDESTESLKRYQKTTFETADAVGTTAKQIQTSTADWQRLGYALSDSADLAKISNLYKNVGDMDITEATEHMISSVQAWKSEFSGAVSAAEAIADRYNKIGNEFAISSADIGQAMETSAAALKAGGNDLNESIGLITAGNLIQQDASTTSSAMKILSLRIRGAKADLNAMGESTDDLSDSTSKLRTELKALTGVDIMKDENTFKSTAQIIQEIGANWDKLTDVSKAATLEKLAGKNRASTVAGLIENYKTIGEVIEAAEHAEGSANEENAKFLDSIDGRMQKLTNRCQEFWATLIDADTVKTGISLVTDLVTAVTKLVDTFGTLPTLVAGLGAAFSTQNLGRDEMWSLTEYAESV